MARKRGFFIERSIRGALSFLKESVFAEEYSRRKGFLQGFDPRIRAASLLVFIITVVCANSTGEILVLYLFSVALAYASKVDIGYFLRRTWVFIPLFTLFIAIPSLFSVFTPGETLLAFHCAGVIVTITRQGVAQAVLFVARVATSVSFAVLLSLTTPHFELLKVLRCFRVPQVFVMTLGICYRYIFLFVGIIENTFTAIKSRVGFTVVRQKGRQIVVWNIAYLWMRSSQFQENVYNAMLSRGFRGEPAIMDEFRTRLQDWLWLLCAAALCVGICIRQYLR